MARARTEAAERLRRAERVKELRRLLLIVFVGRSRRSAREPQDEWLIWIAGDQYGRINGGFASSLGAARDTLSNVEGAWNPPYLHLAPDAIERCVIVRLFGHL